MLKLLDLFSGIGGFSLGLESTGGFETIAFVEKDDFCQKVLKKHWPNTNIEGDIRNVKGDKYEADIITGGFPCQPFSVAGKRKGTDDDRYLWDETIRVVRECKPRWFIGENVEGLININNGLVLRQVQTDLEKEGFEVQCLVIPAAGVGAWHQRKRIWILAHNISNSNSRFSIGQKKEIQTRRSSINFSSEDVSNTKSVGHRGWSSKECKIGEWSFLQGEQEGRKMGSEVKRCDGDVSDSKSIGSDERRYGKNSEKGKIQFKTRREDSNGDVSNSNSERLERHRTEQQLQKNGREKYIVRSGNDETRESWWQTQSRFCGIPDGVSTRMDKNRNNRLKSLGNSIVPQIVRQLGLAILEAEK
jgi:DNA (cytosine-5)-methyltransferase 1